MLILGLLLVVVAIAAGVLLFLATQSLTQPVNLDAAGISVGMTPLALIISGAVVLLLLWLGLALLRGSAKRRARPRREAKETQRQAELEENIRADERKRAEETHQQAMAERDRVREQEFESRLAQRDRAREEEYASRRADDESRIRADERARAERELADRHASMTAAGGGALAGAAAGGAAGAVATSGDHRGEDTVRGSDLDGRHDVTGDGSGTDRPHGGAASLDDSADERRVDDRDLAGPDGGAAQSERGAAGTDAHVGDERTAAEGDGRPGDSNGSDGSDGPEPGRHRTVADKIMGRTGRDDSTS